MVLAAFVIAQPATDPPSIVVSSSIDDNPDDLPDKKIVKKQQKAAASVQQSAPVVTVNSYSAIAVPEIVDNLLAGRHGRHPSKKREDPCAASFRGPKQRGIERRQI